MVDVSDLRKALEARQPPLSARQWTWCTEHTMQRYMVARKGDVQKALVFSNAVWYSSVVDPQNPSRPTATTTRLRRVVTSLLAWNSSADAAGDDGLAGELWC
jgi:hypothetical protein